MNFQPILVKFKLELVNNEILYRQYKYGKNGVNETFHLMPIVKLNYIMTLYSNY